MINQLLFLVASSSLARGSVFNRRATTSSFTSSADGNYKFSSFDVPTLGGANSDGLSNWDFSFQEVSGKKQTVRGFGAALTDGAVTVINELDSSTRSSLLKEIMGPDGLNFNLIRHTVASSDLSANAYTYEDNQGTFGLGASGDDMAKMLSEMRGLQSNLKILGSPWSPPGWMKENTLLTGSTDGNVLNHDFESQYGQYFVDYLNAFEKAGAKIDAITIQNEPFNNKSDMPTMYVTGDESGNLIKNVIAPALKAASLDTEVWSLDHNTNMYDYVEAVENAAGGDVAAIAWHCYSGNDPANWAPLTQAHEQFNKTMYMTECYTDKKVTDWVHSSNYHLLPLQNWAEGIFSWGLATYTNGGPSLGTGGACNDCTGLVTIDPDSKAVTREIDYYMAGQFSRYIPTGASIVNGTGSYLYDDGTGMEAVASINPDGTKTVVIQNRFDNDVFAQVQLESNKDQTWNAKVPGKSVTSWIIA